MVARVEEIRVAVEDVDLSFGKNRVFRGLSCSFPRGTITVVLGGSGGGKSTLLRLIGGLVRPDRGRVLVAGEDITQMSERGLFRVRDRIGMLFQDGALLDSMSVAENVALPLQEHTKLSPAVIAAEVSRRLVAVGLPGTEKMYPRELSGGMRRRAALARTIVTDPEIILCDEPFSGLDPINVRRIEALLVELSERLGITMIVTSHHLASTLRMADRMVFMFEGAAISGAPEELLASGNPQLVEFFQAEGDGSLPDPPAARAGSDGAVA